MKRAYFFAKVKRLIFIEIPAADREPNDEQKVGRLNLNFHGTRDSAMNWQDESIGTLEKNGFTKSKASPCNFYHEVRKANITIHGDDFISLAPRDNSNGLSQYSIKFTSANANGWDRMRMKRSLSKI